MDDATRDEIQAMSVDCAKTSTAAQHEIVMAVDIGGSKFMVGFVDDAGAILASERFEWHYPSPEEVVTALVDAIKSVRAAYPDLARRVRVGGVTIPGFTDPVTGAWLDSDNPVIRDLPICNILHERVGMPFYGDNDGNACVLAESYFGGGRGLDTFFYMTASSGVGGGVFVDGQLYYGTHCESGEVGLMIVEPHGRPSRSGNQIGPLEMYACTEGMVLNYIDAGGTAFDNLSLMGGKEVSEAADVGDTAALKAIELEGLYLGRALANVDAMFAPRRIIVGGGLSLMFDRYEPFLMAELRRIRPHAAVEVVATQLGYTGAFLGAAACALRGMAGFDHACGMGDDLPEIVIRSVGCGELPFSLCVDGSAVCSGELGGMLIASSIKDEGRTLQAYASSALEEVTVARAAAGDGDALEALRSFGYALGRALASCCMLLDPWEISLPAELAAIRVHIEEPLVDALVRDTYWKRDELPYKLAWRGE